MKKDKALGHDPLAWIKATREAESRQAGEVSKPEEKEETSMLEVTHAEVEEIKESPLTEEPQPIQKTEVKQERIHVTHGSGYTTTKEGLVEGRVETPYSTVRTNGSTIIFIIAYAVLLLVLTLFVYFNLSKRIDGMSSRISNIENTLNIWFKEKGIKH